MCDQMPEKELELGELIGRPRKLGLGLEACIYKSEKDVKYKYRVIVVKEGSDGIGTIELIRRYHKYGVQTKGEAERFIEGLKGGIYLCQNQMKKQ